MTPTTILSAVLPAARIGGGGVLPDAPAVTPFARIIGQAARRASGAKVKGSRRDSIGHTIIQVFFQRGPVLPGRSGSSFSEAFAAMADRSPMPPMGMTWKSFSMPLTASLLNLAPGHSAGGLFRGMA